MSNKLKKLKQCNGAVADENSELHECLCSSNRTLLSLAKYENKLNSMTLEELQEVAEAVGLMPVDNRDFLIKSLKKSLKQS